jgi:hypothetical protein
MLSLSALANWESAVLASIHGAQGTVEERDAQITRSGMYAEYPAIFSTYLEHLRMADDAAAVLEALKRLVFLIWYSFKEASVDSGIAELPESGVRAVLQELDAAIMGGRVDAELQWMLTWYYDEFGVVFDQLGPVRSLQPFIADLTTADVLAQRSNTARFAGRGQMGGYWAAVLAG